MPTVKVKGLKGFSEFRAFPTVADTAASYSASGTPLQFVGASNCNVSDNRQEFSIPGDDGIYDSGSELTGVDVEVTIHEVDLEQLAALTGCTINEVKTAIEEGSFDIPNMMAIAYRALRRDGGYRCFRYYCAKLISYSVEHKTKGTSTDGQPYKLKFKCIPRKVDGFVRGIEDVANAAASVAWLATIPTVTLTATP